MKKKFLILYTICLATTCPAWSQSIGPSTINASGGSATISGNTYEFSVGELITTTNTGTGIVITQGVLQPQIAPTSIEDRNFIADNLKLYPNPADDVVFLQPSFQQGGEMSCSLYDASGRIIKLETFTLSTGKEKQAISLKNMAAGSYLLDISFLQKGKTFRGAYKVQKLQ